MDVEDGWWRRMDGGGWMVEDGWWRMDGGGWMVEDGWWIVSVVNLADYSTTALKVG